MGCALRKQKRTGGDAVLTESSVVTHNPSLSGDPLAQRLARYYAAHQPQHGPDKVAAVLERYRRDDDPGLLKCLFADLDRKYGTSEATPDERDARALRDEQRKKRSRTDSASATV